ncbi:MAG: DndE family protein [Pseudomonadales bacterium]
MIPHRVRVSGRAGARLKYLKSKTGLTPNILSRIAFVLSARDLRRVAQVSSELDGQEFNAPTLFGEHQRAYELLLAKYLRASKDDREISTVIASHIENGLHKMGHARSLQDIVALQ